MVPGIAEREIRQHANQRQEWLLGASAHAAGSLSGNAVGTRVVLGAALLRIQQAVAILVRGESAGEDLLGHARPLQLEMETARR